MALKSHAAAHSAKQQRPKRVATQASRGRRNEFHQAYFIFVDFRCAWGSAPAAPARCLRAVCGSGGSEPDLFPTAPGAGATNTHYPARRGGARSIETGWAIQIAASRYAPVALQRQPRREYAVGSRGLARAQSGGGL